MTPGSGARIGACVTRPADQGQQVGLARALSKLGFCSRRQAWDLIQAGQVRLNGVVTRDPERRTDWRRDRLEVGGQSVQAEAKVYLLLNKPRGLVAPAADEQGRATVFQCLAGQGVPSGCQNDVHIMCWMLRALPSASVTLACFRHTHGRWPHFGQGSGGQTHGI